MATAPPDQRCELCRFWIPAATPDPNAGACNRYPPGPTASGDPSQAGAWPVTRNWHWCGEWQLNPPPAQPLEAPRPEPRRVPQVEVKKGISVKAYVAPFLKPGIKPKGKK